MTGATAERQAHSQLLAYALFDLDPRARCLREPLLVFLVSLALYERGRPADRDELLRACREQFLSRDKIDRGQIERVVAAMTKANLLVDAGEGAVDLTADRRRQLNEASARIDSQRDAFHDAIRASVEEALGEALSLETSETLETALDDFIQRLFLEKSVALAKMFGSNGKGFDETTADHLNSKSLESVSGAVAATPDKLERAQVAKGIRAGLVELSGPGQKYLAAVYQRTVASALLEQDPSVRKLKRELAKARVFYLDTNVVMALMFAEHPQHDRVSSVVNAAQEVGCKLAVSSFTVEELEKQLSESNEHYRGLQSRKEAFRIVDDDILRSFACKRAAHPGLLWGAFYATYYPPEKALPDFGIEIVSDEVVDAHHDERRADVRAAVQAAKTAPHPRIVDYDTDNLILIQLRRKQLAADAMGSRVWLITLDRTLKGAEQRLSDREVFRVPSSKRVSAWSADLSPHLSPDDADLAEYALHLVKSQLGLLAEDPVFADVNFLTTLEESPFDLDDLLAGGIEKSLRIILALQEEREIKSILDERPSSPADHDEWAERFAEAVKDALEKLDRSDETAEAAEAAERERDQALRRELLAKRERDLSLRRVAELQLALERRRIRSWLARFANWFRRDKQS